MELLLRWGENPAAFANGKERAWNCLCQGVQDRGIRKHVQQRQVCLVSRFTACLLFLKQLPYCGIVTGRITYEGKEYPTKTKTAHAGGGTVEFDEILSFKKLQEKDMMKVTVSDGRTVDIDLSKIPVQGNPASVFPGFCNLIDEAHPMKFNCKDREGKTVGTVYLGFAACLILVKLYHIEERPDGYGRPSDLAARCFTDSAIRFVRVCVCVVRVRL